MKGLINTLWGKSIAKDYLAYTKVYNRDQLLAMLEYNKGFVMGFKRIAGTENYTVKFVKPICIPYTHPQFGINVLSFSCTKMHSLIDMTEDGQIFYSNTDCIVMRRAQSEELNRMHNGSLIGLQLGQMQYEFTERARKFICLSPKKYIFCFKDGGFKVRYGPKEGDPEEYFEMKYRALMEK
jgi:hypothetical protein